MITACPFGTSTAHPDAVWTMLTDPLRLDEWWDARLESVDPPGSMTPGQHLVARAAAGLRVTLDVIDVDSEGKTLRLLARKPVPITLFMATESSYASNEVDLLLLYIAACLTRSPDDPFNGFSPCTIMEGDTGLCTTGQPACTAVVCASPNGCESHAPVPVTPSALERAAARCTDGGWFVLEGSCGSGDSGGATTFLCRGPNQTL